MVNGIFLSSQYPCQKLIASIILTKRYRSTVISPGLSCAWKKFYYFRVNNKELFTPILMPTFFYRKAGLPKFTTQVGHSKRKDKNFSALRFWQKTFVSQCSWQKILILIYLWQKFIISNLLTNLLIAVFIGAKLSFPFWWWKLSITIFIPRAYNPQHSLQVTRH